MRACSLISYRPFKVVAERGELSVDNTRLRCQPGYTSCTKAEVDTVGRLVRATHPLLCMGIVRQHFSILASSMIRNCRYKISCVTTNALDSALSTCCKTSSAKQTCASRCIACCHPPQPCRLATTTEGLHTRIILLIQCPLTAVHRTR